MRRGINVGGMLLGGWQTAQYLDRSLLCRSDQGEE